MSTTNYYSNKKSNVPARLFTSPELSKDSDLYLKVTDSYTLVRVRVPMTIILNIQSHILNQISSKAMTNYW